jgi:hypothetical protein
MQDLSGSRADSEEKTRSNLLQVILANLFAFVLILILILIAALLWIARPSSDALTSAFIGVIGVVGAMMLKTLYFDPKNDRAAKAQKEADEKKKADELKMQLHKALYSEMGRAYGETKGNMVCLKKKSLYQRVGYELGEQGVVPLKAYKDTKALWTSPTLKGCFDLYDGVRTGDPALFYELPDALAIDSVYSLLKDALWGMPSDTEKTVETTINDVEFAFFFIEYSLWTGLLELDLWLLRDCTPAPYTEYINELIIRAESSLPVEILKERRANPRVAHYFGGSSDFKTSMRTLGCKRKHFDVDKFMQVFNSSQKKRDCTLVDAIVKGLEANSTSWLATPSEEHDPVIVKLASLIRDQLSSQYAFFDLQEKWLNSATFNVRCFAVDKATSERQMHSSTLSHFASIDDATNYVDQLDKTGYWSQREDPDETTLYEVVTGKTPTTFKHYEKLGYVGDRVGWILQNDDLVLETSVSTL